MLKFACIKKFYVIVLALLALCFYQMPLANATSTRVLVLYDAPKNQEFSRLGMAYAIMLRNLLGHFETTVDMLPVESYTTGNIENYQTTFYVGSYYDNPLPKSFLADVTKTQKTVVWFRDNIWQLVWDPLYNAPAKFGFNLIGLQGFDTTPSAANPTPAFFDTVLYKSMNLKKYYAFNTATGVALADPTLAALSIVDASKAQSLVTIKNSQTNQQLPYIVRSSNFWYFADLPLTFIGPRDRYLVLCDMLHDILGVKIPSSRRALVRLEDVSAKTSTSALNTLSDYLKSRNVPFSLAVIPFYRDPRGVYNGGVSREVTLDNATALKASLNYALARGGKIVMHGYTHQYGDTPNAVTGVSGDDFEFWNAVANTPVAEDSAAWAAGRLDAGLAMLRRNGYAPVAWETPHYQASPLSMRSIVPARFENTYQRVVYYTADKPDLSAGKPNRDFAVGQFFPYVIYSDYYGQRVIPENLGNITYDDCLDKNAPCFRYTWQDIVLNAQYAQVVRDGVASFFFHPFLLDPAFNRPTAYADFQSLVQSITQLGYRWAEASAMPQQDAQILATAAPNQSFFAGDFLQSPNKRFQMIFQGNGNLVLFDTLKQQIVWSTNTAGRGAVRAIFQLDGNLVLYNAANAPIWASNTWTSGATSLVIQDDGNLVLYTAAHKPVWASNTVANPVTGTPKLLAGQQLFFGDFLLSANKRFRLTFQSNGDVVLFDSQAQKNLWSSNTVGRRAVRAIFQADGNFVLYTSANQPVWASNTWNKGGVSLIMQADGNAVIYTSLNRALWATGTNIR